jgi:pyruvate formate lyase activating enzyme
MEKKGIIFAIEKFAVHDGPGIRSTVFLKGCPLRCGWCHNPEGISSSPEIMVFAQRCLPTCRACIKVCPRKALSRAGQTIVLDRDRCQGCGACALACPAEALRLAGQEVDRATVMEELAKDALFYQSSNGGVTFSGGEPLQQVHFLRGLLRDAKKQGWHTAVDTCGQASFADFAAILPLVDLFLYDLKCVDPRKHRRLTGVDNGQILENLAALSRSARSLAVRVPLVPGSNDSEKDLEQMAEFCSRLPRPHPVHVLPYHRGGGNKRGRLDQRDPLPDVRPPTDARVRRALEIFTRYHISVSSGG